MALWADITPMLALDPVQWAGLPEARVSEFATLFGPAVFNETSQLGAYPAQRHVFHTDAIAGNLTVWSRDALAVLAQTEHQPVAAVLQGLPEPDRILPGEFDDEDDYITEWLYPERGLVLTIAEELGEADDDSEDGPPRILRFRGIRPDAKLADFYLGKSDRDVFSDGGADG